MNKIARNTLKAILLVLPLIFSGCKFFSFQASNSILKIEKSKCYGKCPVYSAIIDDKKYIKFYPKENTKIKTPSFATVTKSEFKELMRLIKSINIQNLNSVYDNELLMDVPATYITFYNGQNKKKIKLRANIPKNLRRLIQELDKIIESRKWKSLI